MAISSLTAAQRRQNRLQSESGQDRQRLQWALSVALAFEYESCEALRAAIGNDGLFADLVALLRNRRPDSV